MKILEIILVTILFILLLISLLLLLPLRICAILDEKYLTIKLGRLKVFRIESAKLIANILQSERQKIEINVKSLIESFLFVGLEIIYANEQVDVSDYLLFGALGIINLFIPNTYIHHFIFKRVTTDDKSKIIVVVKIQILKTLLNVIINTRSKSYEKIG